MLRLSKKSEYGVRALVEIAMRAQNSEQWYQISQIAEATRIPEKFLEQILLSLKNGGVLKSRRGIEGGYALREAPVDIHMDQVVGLLDGAGSAEAATLHKEIGKLDISGKVYGELILKARQASLEVLHKVSLRDLVDEVRKQRLTNGESLEYQI